MPSANVAYLVTNGLGQIMNDQVVEHCDMSGIIDLQTFPNVGELS